MSVPVSQFLLQNNCFNYLDSLQTTGDQQLSARSLNIYDCFLMDQATKNSFQILDQLMDAYIHEQRVSSRLAQCFESK